MEENTNEEWRQFIRQLLVIFKTGLILQESEK